MQTHIEIEKKPDVQNPLLVVGLTGIGNVGRTAVSYLIDQLEASKFAELYSPHFPHITILNENDEMQLLNNEFYFYKNPDGDDVIFMTGHTQSVSPEGHYEIVETVLNTLADYNIKEIITIGGFGAGEIVEEPSVYGIVSNAEIQKRYENTDMSFDHSVGEVIGASGLFIGIGKRHGIDGLCILGETPGFLLSDPKATEEVLKNVESILNIDIDYENVNEKIQELEKVLNKIQKLQGDLMQGQGQQQGEKDLTYIG